jgi:hypothetical protein
MPRDLEKAFNAAPQMFTVLRASGCPRSRAPVDPDASSPIYYKRQLPAVGLLPSGPELVSAIILDSLSRAPGCCTQLDPQCLWKSVRVDFVGSTIHSVAVHD